MTLEQAFFIIRHGSYEGHQKYLEAVRVIEDEYNRQKAEIERLNGILESYALQYGTATDKEVFVQTVKAAGILEFFERLMEKAYIPSPYGKCLVVDEYDIVNLAEEMTGWNKGGDTMPT